MMAADDRDGGDAHGISTRAVSVATFAALSVVVFLSVTTHLSLSPPSASSSSSASASSSSSSSRRRSLSNKFTLTSAAIGDDQVLPDDYTCKANVTNVNDDWAVKNAAGVSPPLAWTNAPSNTQSFMLTMTSSNSGGSSSSSCARYELTLYDIPASVSSLEAGNAANVGEYAGTWPGSPEYKYASPCGWSGSGGYMTYTFTLYALKNSIGSSSAIKKALKKAVRKGDGDGLLGPQLVEYVTANKWVKDTATLDVKFCNNDTGVCTDDEEEFVETLDCSSLP